MTTERLIRRATAHLRAYHPIPLDLYAQLDAAGVDINELERTARNGTLDSPRFDVV